MPALVMRPVMRCTSTPSRYHRYVMLFGYASAWQLRRTRVSSRAVVFFGGTMMYAFPVDMDIIYVWRICSQTQNSHLKLDHPLMSGYHERSRERFRWWHVPLESVLIFEFHLKFIRDNTYVGMQFLIFASYYYASNQTFRCLDNLS